jgi:hypothetical protein
MSIKYYVGKLFGTQPPAGAEGMMAVLDSPAGQKLMKSGKLFDEVKLIT